MGLGWTWESGFPDSLQVKSNLLVREPHLESRVSDDLSPLESRVSLGFSIIWGKEIGHCGQIGSGPASFPGCKLKASHFSPEPQFLHLKKEGFWEALQVLLQLSEALGRESPQFRECPRISRMQVAGRPLGLQNYTCALVLILHWSAFVLIYIDRMEI